MSDVLREDVAMLPRPSQAAVEQVIGRAALGSERVLAWARIAVSVASLARTFWLWIAHGIVIDLGRVGLTSVCTLAALGISIWVLTRLRSWVPRQRLLLASAVFDVLLVFAVLLVNPLWPGPGYRGLLHLPESAALLLVSVAASLRLSPRVAAIASVASAVAFAVLVGIDQGLVAPPVVLHEGALTSWLILHAVAIGLAVATARRSRELVTAGARRALRAAQAEQNLHVLLRDHHDVRTLLSSATLGADRLGRQLSGDRGFDVNGLRELATSVREDLQRVGAFVSEIRERSWDEIAVQDQLAPASVADAVTSVLETLRARFRETQFDLAIPVDHAVWVAGGEAALRRILWNVLVNACEGDGRRGATHVEITSEATDGTLAIRVRDDGPGFPAEALAADVRSRFTSKATGSGLGLLLAGDRVRASEGELERGNRGEGGAEVKIHLPAADPAVVPQE